MSQERTFSWYSEQLEACHAKVERLRAEYGVALEMLLERGVRPAEVDDRIRQRKVEFEAEREQYDRLIWCEQSGHMVEGDSCSCGKVTVDIAGREHGRWA